MAEQKKRLLSGAQPSGKAHLGNYLGALKQWVELSEAHDSMFMVADYHTLTSLKDPAQVQENIYDLAADIIAVGIDPEKSIIFQQSEVPEHTELTWIFNCLVSVSFLMQAHAYKDKVAKGLEANAGLFDYPMLMAADILLYDTDIVPVGQDQRQHVEYAREAATKFNNAYGETFAEPREYILDTVAVVPGTDGQKMSKSYGNTIPLFGTDDEIRTAVMGIVTSSTPAGEPLDAESDTVFALHKHFSKEQLPELEKRYREGAIGYKESKETLADNVIALIAPMRDKRDALTHDEIRKILQAGGEKARERASQKMRDVRKKVGVAL
ncbi:MAG: tryptophan--tRNA ligase [bacterium]|nr:tryptophan--tRNA ligase [bacterium]